MGSRGARSDSRYYGPQDGWKGRRRDVGQADDAPYEGPTIFDEVFRTKKKGDDESGGRGERERDQVMEREWRRCKGTRRKPVHPQEMEVNGEKEAGEVFLHQEHTPIGLLILLQSQREKILFPHLHHHH